MQKSIGYLLLVVLLLSSVLKPLEAQACSCIEPPGIEEELSRSDAVFSGKVIAADEKSGIFSAPAKSFVFEVGQVWKGIEQTQVKITTGIGGGDCGIDFKMGQEYLVYAIKSDSYGAGSLSTIICDRTMSLSQAQADFEVLGVGQEPTEEVDLVSRTSWLYWTAAFIVLAITIFAGYRKKKKSG